VLFTESTPSQEPILFLGDGSNLICSDSGFAGLAIRNRILGKEQCGVEVEVFGGENLSGVIRWLNQQGLSGLERMYGIPGTVAGALVGNAGAYGQEIGDVVVEIRVWEEQGFRTLSREELDFGYRHSLFRFRSGCFIISCRLRLKRVSGHLQAISDEILSRRLKKYPVGLKCPGSFFRNVPFNRISQEARERVPEAFVVSHRIPAGKLLEAVGARGVRKGDAQFAPYHGNLIMNLGHACSDDILGLANEYAGRVWERFRIQLEPEVVIIDDKQWPCLRPLEEEL
jgi:UDP-N-acetylmuramate dehydrogenase